MKLTSYFIILCSLILCGCENTVKGIGQDMQKNGQEIQKSVNS
jgi:predicted small secreted protein